MARRGIFVTAIMLLIAASASYSHAQKKNDRPQTAVQEQKGRSSTGVFTHIYEFDRPEFAVSRVKIRHDEAGSGDITFSLTDFDEPITDPIKLSSATLGRISEALENMDFLNSHEDYQFEKDYPHLGTIRFTLEKLNKKRTVSFNWTEHAGAKALMDEYRRIGNQFIWMFKMESARANQPLEAPKLMDQLVSYVKRNEVSDPEQMIPYLTKLGDDENIPLMARNGALRLVKEIERRREKATR